MERTLIVTDGTFAGADASAYLKRVLFLSSLPALAGRLWRFAPLPGFSAIYRSLSISARRILSRFSEFHFGYLSQSSNIVTTYESDDFVLSHFSLDVDVKHSNIPLVHLFIVGRKLS
ncbi:MAG: hypothetical protein JAZ12_12770 [Candidatus Thiodiazotropha taylori]|nr:hypothetical protein [Candidatus Thiodiazotropha taylori]